MVRTKAMKAEESGYDDFTKEPSAIVVSGQELLRAPFSAESGRLAREALLHEKLSPYVEREDSETVGIRLQANAVNAEEIRIEYVLCPSCREGFFDSSDKSTQVSEGRSIPMEPYASVGEVVYYRGLIPAREGLLRYRFMLKDGGSFALYTPSGVHTDLPGVDDWFQLDLAELPVFATPEWVKDAVVYQIFPERFANGDPTNDPLLTLNWGKAPTAGSFFGGDFQGVIDNIPYLEALGITAIWFNPVFEAPSNHKYDTSDYLKIDPSLGSLDKFKEMVSRLHSAGIKVILDGVFNHTGYEFRAFQDIIKNGQASRYVDWYYVHDFPIRRAPKPNYEAWWDLPDLPKLNMENSEVRRYILDVVLYWMDLGVDGWRLDVPNEVEHSFWREFRSHVKGINSDAYIVGEIWHNGKPWLEGDQFDAVMNYVFRDAVLDYFARRACAASAFVNKLESMRASYPHAASMALLNLLGSHDTERVLTAFHGNKEQMLPAIVFQMTYPGAPMVYYGDEIGMRGDKDPGCRGTMIWDKSKQDQGLHRLYQHLIRIRKGNVPLRRGNMRWLVVDDPTRTLAFSRAYDGEVAVVAACSGDAEVSLDLSLDRAEDGAAFVDVLTDRSYEVSGGRLRVCGLRSNEARVLVQKESC